ncbi:hypothetical protein ACVWXL_002469 [Bradyrhizobium sp. GM22.5]
MTNTATGPLPASVLEALGRYDTPTICNAMEIVAPERRLIGYTTKPLVCPFPDLPPIVGYARTVAIRSVLKNSLPPEEQSKRRIAYYEYVGTGHGPRISVIQDIDGPDVGYGAFWGEVQSNVHKARSAASASSPTVRSATFRNGRRASRRWPARSARRMPGCTPRALAAKCASPA